MRYAVAGDIPAIRDLERRAGAPFREIGLDVVADDEPPAVGVLRGAVRDRAVLVVEVVEDASDASDASDAAAVSPAQTGVPGVVPSAAGSVAWMWLSVADGDLLLEQVSVDPGYRGLRIGSGLVDAAVDHARGRRFPGVVLTTFSDVPWNGPLYRRLGFRDMPDADIGPELREIRRAETAAGLDVLPRVCLRRATGV